jgi:hypothetical protein
MDINTWINMAKYNFRIMLNYSDRDIFTDPYAILYTSVCNMRDPVKSAGELYTIIKSLTKRTKISLISPVDFRSIYYTFRAQSDAYNLSIINDLISIHIASITIDLLLVHKPANIKDLATNLGEQLKIYNHKLPNYSPTLQKINSAVSDDFMYFSIACAGIRMHTLNFVYYYTLLISSSAIDSYLVIYYSPTNNYCKLHKKFKNIMCEYFKTKYPHIYSVLSPNHKLSNTVVEFTPEEYEVLITLVYSRKLN